MPWPNNLNVALKEWATLCGALAMGRQIILLRKGGVYEAATGFEVENREFLLFPTYLHQKPESLKPSEHAELKQRDTEPDRIGLHAAAVVTDVLRLKHRAQLDTIDHEHIWTPPLIDMRFNYRPGNPLYLLVVRTFHLPQPVIIQNTPHYAGCKSWVSLEEQVNTEGAIPVLDASQYEARRGRILDELVNRPTPRFP